jgi:hypothetical protein
LLTELIVRTEGDQVERAWKAIDFVVGRRWQDDQAMAHKLKGHLWKPLRKLMEKARVEREKAIASKVKQDTDTEAKVQDSMSSFDPAVPISNLDFGVDRLYPLTDSIVHDTSADWTDPRLDQNIFPALTSHNMIAGNIITTSIDQKLSPATMGQLPSQLDLTPSWIMNDSNMSSAPLVTSASPQVASPLLADGSVNWASWDDMVSQFGMDVDAIEPNAALNQPGFSSSFGPLSQWY